MPTHVYANNNEVASKAADGKSIAAFPDVCFSPPAPPVGPMPLPYPNTGEVKDTDSGTAKVFIKDKMSGMAGDSHMTKSMGDEAATQNFNKGMITGALQGKCYFGLWSMDVQMEGKGVPRHLDMVTHNHGSKPCQCVKCDCDGSCAGECVCNDGSKVESKFYMRIIAVSDSKKISRYIFDTKTLIKGNSLSISIQYTNGSTYIESIEINISNISFKGKNYSLDSAIYKFSGKKEEHEHIIQLKEHLRVEFENQNNMTIYLPMILVNPRRVEAPKVTLRVSRETTSALNASNQGIGMEYELENFAHIGYVVDIVKENIESVNRSQILTTDNELVKKIKQCGVSWILSRYTELKYKTKIINLFAVRSSIKIANNRYNDAIGVIRKDGEQVSMQIYNGTTIAGTSVFLYPRSGTTRKGTPILKTGQHAYRFGRHLGKVRAIVPNASLNTYRDTDKDKVIDLENLAFELGSGLNLHTSSTGSDESFNNAAKVDTFRPYITGNSNLAGSEAKPYSEGCQVVQNPKDYLCLFDTCWAEINKCCPRRDTIATHGVPFASCASCKHTDSDTGYNKCYMYYTVFDEDDIVIKKEIVSRQRLDDYKE